MTCHRTASLPASLLPFPDLVDHPAAGGALGVGGVLTVPLRLGAGDDLLARRARRQPQDRRGHRGHHPAAARPAGCRLFGGTLPLLFPHFLFPRTGGMLWEREGRIVKCKSSGYFKRSKKSMPA